MTEKIYILLLLLTLWACGAVDEKKKDSVPSDTKNQIQSDREPSDRPLLPLSKYASFKKATKGLLLEELNQFYTDSLSGYQASPIAKGSIVDIIKVTDSMYELPDDPADECRAVYMVYVKYEGKKLWLDGRKIYGFDVNKPEYLLSVSGGERYKFYRTEYFGTGLWDKIGLSGCGSIHPMVIHKGNNFYYISDIENKYEIPMFNNDVYELFSGEGGEANIRNGIMLGDTILLNIKVQYQIDSARYKSLFYYTEKGYKSEITEYERVTPDMGR